MAEDRDKQLRDLISGKNLDDHDRVIKGLDGLQKEVKQGKRVLVKEIQEIVEHAKIDESDFGFMECRELITLWKRGKVS